MFYYIDIVFIVVRGIIIIYGMCVRLGGLVSIGVRFVWREVRNLCVRVLFVIGIFYAVRRLVSLFWSSCRNILIICCPSTAVIGSMPSIYSSAAN